MRDPHKYHVYTRARQLVVLAHHLAENPALRRAPGLSAQIKRCAASIPANFAEGAGASGDSEFARYVGMAISSAIELESHIERIVDLQLLTHMEVAPTLDELIQIRRMLYGLRRRLLAA